MNRGSVGAGYMKGFPTEPLNGMCFLPQPQLLLNSTHLRGPATALFFGDDVMSDFTSEASHNVPEETGSEREVTEHFFLPGPHFILSQVCILLHKAYDFVLI